MQQHINDFIIYLTSEKGASKHTIEAYYKDVWHFSTHVQKSSRSSWQEVQKQDLIDFLSLKKKESYASSSRARLLTALKMFFRFLKRENIIEHNPAADLESPRIEQQIPTTLSEMDIQKLLALPDLSTCEGARDVAILELLYACGLRVSELCCLKIYDIDDQFVKVTKGKGGKQRLIPLGSHALKAIDNYLAFRPEGPEEALFLSKRGRPVNRIMIWKMVKEYSKRAKIEKIVSPHTFRHTCASDLLENGADIRIIQEILGHADISSTERYTQVSNEEVRKSFETFHPRYRR